MPERSSNETVDEFLVRLAADLATTRTMGEVAGVISQSAGAVVGATLSIFALWSTDDDAVRVVLPQTAAGALKDRWERIPVGANTLVTECVRTGKPVIAETFEEMAERFPSGLEDAKRLGLQSAAAFPINTGSDELRAAVGVTWDRPHATSDHPSLDALLGLCGAVVDRVRCDEETQLVAIQQQRIAQQLQSGLLPSRLPEIPGYDVAFRYEAAADKVSVGGDWYDVIDLGSDEFAVVIGDVVGHDLQAAITMSQLRNALAGASHMRPAPSKVLCALDDFAQHSPSSSMATTFYGRLRSEDGRLSYSSGGHPAPIIVREGGGIEFLDEATGPPVGVPGDRPSATINLEPGDILFCYTDGLLEHRSEHIDIGIERLVKSLSAAGVEMALDLLIDTVCDEVPHPDREDDIALLAIRRRTGDGSPAEDT